MHHTLCLSSIQSKYGLHEIKSSTSHSGYSYSNAQILENSATQILYNSYTPITCLIFPNQTPCLVGSKRLIFVSQRSRVDLITGRTEWPNYFHIHRVYLFLAMPIRAILCSRTTFSTFSSNQSSRCCLASLDLARISATLMSRIDTW